MRDWVHTMTMTTTTRSREGNGRHRQPWQSVRCPGCDQVVSARRTLPGRPWHVRAHLTDDGLCPTTTLTEVVPEP